MNSTSRSHIFIIHQVPPNPVLFVLLRPDISILTPPSPAGIVGLDFKAARIVQISSSVLPISSVAIIINNKGYPVYHPRIDKYKYEDVNTKLHKFQWTEDNRQVGRLLHGSVV